MHFRRESIRLNAKNINDLLQGEMISSEVTDTLFDSLDKQLLDEKEMVLDLGKVTFISVYFLERLEQFTSRAKDLNAQLQITGVHPSIYKVFQVAKASSILEVCK